MELERQFLQLIRSPEEANILSAYKMVKDEPKLHKYLQGYLILYRYFFDEKTQYLEIEHFTKLNQPILRFYSPHRTLYKSRSTVLPKEIGLLQNLKSLSLEYNYLTAIPPEIGQLTQLEQLNLSYNFLESLPAEIGNLKNLVFISLKDNQLQIFPKGLLQLAKLKYIDIEDNELSSVPRDISQLPYLRKICLYGNPISRIKKMLIQKRFSHISIANYEINRKADDELSLYY